MMMDNPTHHHAQVVQLTNPNSTNVQPKPPGELENFLTIRLLMQGKVCSSMIGMSIAYLSL